MAEAPNASKAPAAPSRPPGDGDEWIGRSLGEFLILRRLGKGGMGQVFLAEQRSLKRKVAIKVLRPELAANKTALERFHVEAHNIAKLTHANIVQIYALDEQDGIHYMVLEYVEGRNLRDYIQRKGPPELPICLSIMRQVTAALVRASESGLVHRDIKPENILLTKKGEVKVADFGLSRCFAENNQPLNLTQSGVAMGTPLYMSPEQVQGKPVDPRCDIYSFGVTCYHMLAGQPPFRGASAFEVALKHVQEQPQPLEAIRPDLPSEMCEMVRRMMAKNPDERYQNCRDLFRDLNRLKESMTGAASSPPISVTSMGSSASGGSPTMVPATGAQTVDWVEPAPHRTLMRVALVLILLGVFAGGVAARLLKNRLFSADKPPPPAPVQAIETNEERLLREVAEQHADPDVKDNEKVKRGLHAQIDLAVYLLKRGRIDDSQKFFLSLQNRNYRDKPAKTEEHLYKVFARFGLALVLAYHDKPNDSLTQLGKVISKGPAPMGDLWIEGIPFPIDSFELRRILADALDRNARNLKVEKLERPLFETLRRPPIAFDPKRPKKP
jgi:serine/threonine-protein kinase